MTTLEAGEFIGIISGGLAGALLCKPYGLLAETGGAIAGGIAGLFVGIGLAFVPILGKVYWEVLTGRRKLPSDDSTSVAHRRGMYKLIAAPFIVSVPLLVSLYFTGSDAVRARVLASILPLFGTTLIGLLFLMMTYRRHPPRKED